MLDENELNRSANGDYVQNERAAGSLEDEPIVDENAPEAHGSADFESGGSALDADESPDSGADTRTEMGVLDWLQSFVSAVVIGIFVFVFIGRMIGVEQTSMLPTLHEKDRVIISNLFYTPKNGDIVIFRTEAIGDTPYVKRVVAVGGQTIDINFETGEVIVDGVVLDEPYVNTPTNRRQDFNGPLTIPEGHVFLMGDNRNSSVDSRSASIWTVDSRYIIGKVLFVLVPGIGPDNNRDWSRIGPLTTA